MPPIFGRSLHTRLVTTSSLHERYRIFAALCTRDFALLQTRFLASRVAAHRGDENLPQRRGAPRSA
jgi:hypothetical protein